MVPDEQMREGEGLPGQVAPAQSPPPRRTLRDVRRGAKAAAVGWLRTNADWLSAMASAVQVVGLPLLLIGILATIRQLGLTAEQVRYAAGQTQGQIIQAVGKDGRELFLKVWEDEGLRFIMDTSYLKKADERRAEAFIGAVIGHYALVYRQEKLGNIPEDYWNEVVIDARQLFKSRDVAERWKLVKKFYRQDFQKFVDGL